MRPVNIHLSLTKLSDLCIAKLSCSKAKSYLKKIYSKCLRALVLCLSTQISAVRAVVPNKSNNEIVLVLQHFENSVDKAVQAFLEGM